MINAEAAANDRILLSGNTYNTIAKAVNAYLRERGITGGSDAASNFPAASATVKVKNTTGAVVAFGGVVALSGPAFTPSQAGFRTSDLMAAVAPASNSLDFAIALQSIPAGHTGLAAVAGLAKARVDVTNTSHKYATRIVSDTTKLASSYTEDEFRIVWKETQNTGIQWAVVEFHGIPQTMTYAGRPTVPITPGGSGSVTLYDKGVSTGVTVTAYLDWAHGNQQVSAAKDVAVTYFRNEGRWRITMADCEA